MALPTPAPLIVKIGGGAAINLDGIADDIAAIAGQVVIVHGANAERDRIAAALGSTPRVLTSVSGYASVYSDDTAIEMLMLAYAGLQNKRLVERLQVRGRQAVGLSGLDGRLVSGVRNRGIRVEGGKTLLVRDRSGKPASVNTDLLSLLLDHAYTPVITMPLADESGRAMNAENDDVVALLQAVLGSQLIVELVEAAGMLRDPGDPASIAARLEPEDLQAWESRSTGRFKRKLLAFRRMFDGRDPTIVVADGRSAHPVADALDGVGTVIARTARAAEGV